MKAVFHHFSRKHLHVFLGLCLAFAGWTLLVLSSQSQSDWQGNWNVAATVGSFSGPFTGAIARHFQPCCWRFSIKLLPYCAAFLLGGFVFQFVPIPWKSAGRALHLVGWSIGLLGGFPGGVVSFTHALS